MSVVYELFTMSDRLNSNILLLQIYRQTRKCNQSWVVAAGKIAIKYKMAAIVKDKACMLQCHQVFLNEDKKHGHCLCDYKTSHTLFLETTRRLLEQKYGNLCMLMCYTIQTLNIHSTEKFCQVNTLYTFVHTICTLMHTICTFVHTIYTFVNTVCMSVHIHLLTLHVQIYIAINTQLMAH